MAKVKIHPSWHKVLQAEFEKPYFEELIAFVKKEYTSATIYPQPTNIFRAFELCPFENVEVVILGQDPYHGKGQANGLCFSVNDGIALPPSLQNIYKEIADDLQIKPPPSARREGERAGLPRSERTKQGNLDGWANQGVLLLNATLTVRANSAGSHQNKGWEEFTDSVIKSISENKKHVVFLLWGKYAQDKGAIIDRAKHHVLTAPHPSPFSAHTGFFGCKHFSKTNEYLKSVGKKIIDWYT